MKFGNQEYKRNRAQLIYQINVPLMYIKRELEKNSRYSSESGRKPGRYRGLTPFSINPHLGSKIMDASSDSAIWKACELSTIESAVTVIISELKTVCVSKSESAVTANISELLSVCVANLYKDYCSCYLCLVFSRIIVNKPSFSVIMLVGLSNAGQFS
ncbi:hypothetical protein AVEN_40748-1 [Araneus ventricosus]|uniref:Uncharacterized protein n=1 Tax=Araneus ventricosus TaxID=182803 RepID=A0A4Y2EM50_ARAVE|nr:hypothetical protein AVEN_40748-1 [Araneus ventricosus]